MERSELIELHYITHISNMPSILDRGILSNERAKRHNPVSVAMEEIQAKRSIRTVPRGRRIHTYACLYLHARNPMLRKILNRHEELTILRVHTDALDIPSAIIADGNASSGYTRFYPSPDGLQNLQSSLVLARYWTSEDPYDYMHKKRTRCAELLVPDKIPSELITGAYVSGSNAHTRLLRTRFALPIAIDHDLFFGAGA